MNDENLKARVRFFTVSGTPLLDREVNVTVGQTETGDYFFAMQNTDLSAPPACLTMYNIIRSGYATRLEAVQALPTCGIELLDPFDAGLSFKTDVD